MNEPAQDLERLISRHLDGETAPAERRALSARLRRDPAAAALFEQYRALDDEIGRTLRQLFGRTTVARRSRPVWERAARLLGLAAAACLAAACWLTPPDRPASRQARAGGPSWFAPPPSLGDTLVRTPPGFVRPQIRLGKPQSEWILIPSDRPGEFLVVEVNRVVTKAVHIQRDF